MFIQRFIKYLFYFLAVLLTGNTTANTRDIAIQSAQQFQQQDKVVIAVGISNYNTPDTGFGRLKYAASDAQLLANTLRSKADYHPVQILNHHANKQNILNKITQAGKLFPRGEGTLIFAFSGHGYNEGGRSYLATYDALATNLKTSGLTIQEVVKAIRQTGVRRAILLIDACRNDPTPDMKSAGRKALGGINPGRGIQVLYSTSSADVSWEHDSLKHGVFSYYVNQALNGKAADNGIVTFSSLARYVEREVAKWTNSRFAQTQQPYRGHAGEMYGDFVLVANGLGPRRHNQANPHPPVTHQQPARQPQPTIVHQPRVQPTPQTTARPPKRQGKRMGQYIDHRDGTVTDTKSGLMWKKCSEGQSGSNCSNGIANIYKWDDAVKYFSETNFAGYNDWRLPTINELRTLVYCSNGTPQSEAWDNSCTGKKNRADSYKYQSPAVRQEVFPNTGFWYWSSTQHRIESSHVWYIQFGFGHHSWNNRKDRQHIRLVRSI